MWTRIEPIDERSGDTGSESSVRSVRSVRGRISDEEIGVAVTGDGGSQDGIWQTTTITVEEAGPESNMERRGKSWLT